MHERPRPARFQFNGDFGQQPNIPAAHIRSQKRVLLSPDETPGHRQPVGGIACGIRFPGIPLIFDHDSLQLRKIRIVRKIVVGRAHPSARHSARPGNDARHVPAVKPADRVPERRIRDSGNGDERYQRIAGDKHDPGIAAGGGSLAPGYRRVKPIHSEAYAAAQPARQRVRPEALRHLSVRSLRRNNLPDAQCNQQSNPFFHRKHTFGQHKITDILRRTKSGAQNQTKSTEIITETSCCYRNNSYICIVKQPNSNQILRIL